VSELEQAWALALGEAEARAREKGLTDIADYLALRTSNDLLRKTGTEWLLGTFEKVAAEANRAGAPIQITRQEGHRFNVGAASMVGSNLALSRGVRVLLIEAGWPRVPRDGFIREGGLACAHIKHLGMKTVSDDLRLMLNESGAPIWIVRRGKPENSLQLHEADIRRHVKILLEDSRPLPHHS
jgi:hypothetical protein